MGFILINNYSLSSLGAFKNEILEESKKSKNNDLEDLVYRFQLTYDEIVGILELKYLAGSSTGFTFVPSVYEVTDNNMMSKSLLPKEAKVNITIDDVRLKSNLTTNKTISLTNLFSM